jgi:hypothetical protein
MVDPTKTNPGTKDENHTPSRSSLEKVVEGDGGAKTVPSSLPPLVSRTAIETMIEEKVDKKYPLLDPDEYLTLFTERYKGEDDFRDVVHEYLDLTVFQRAGLAIGKRVFKKWYDQKTDSMVEHYAETVRKGVLSARDIMHSNLLKKYVEEEVEEKSSVVKKTNQSYERLENERQSLVERRDQERVDNLVQINQDREKKLRLLERQREEAKAMASAQEVIGSHIRKKIENSSVVKKDSSGILLFDEEKIMGVLENLFLDEIIEGINNEDGGSFFTKIQSEFEGLVSHWEQINDLSELPRVNWIMSTIHSRAFGHQNATFPYLMVGQMEGFQKVNASIDTATCLDTSGSMSTDKLNIAKKTSLSIGALMKRLNPNNECFLSHYNNKLHEVSSIEMYREVTSHGYTRTDLALNWLVDKLAGRGPSIANLITDGYPYSSGVDAQELAYEAAEKFQDHPYLMLRIYLVDGDAEARGIVKKIGKIASGGDNVSDKGKKVRFIPVDSSALGGNVIRNVHEAIQGMYDLDEF